MKKNKMNKYYLLLIVFVVTLFIILYFRFTHVTFILHGDNPYMLEYSSEYIEWGFAAHNGFGKDVSENVTIEGQIDENKEGVQYINYIYNYDGIKKTLTREVIVLENPLKEYDFILNGESTVYIDQGSIYSDLGAYVINRETGVKSNDITVYNYVNTAIPGKYKVIYYFSSNDKRIARRRKVVVLPKNEKIISSPDKKTAQIELDFSNIDNYTKTVLPNGISTTEKYISYKVNANGEYHFIVYNNDKILFDKTVIVQELLSDIKCNGVIKTSGTNLSLVTSNLDILKVTWNIDGKIENGNTNYVVNKKVNNVSANIELKDGTKLNVDCQLEKKLVYQFKYDEFNQKDFMKCDTYTPQDKVNLDAKLKEAVNDAGYGTRAGVVEAARFLVGALDYKVPYLGPKTVNTELGRYNQVGLNIGSRNGWGCNVSGWIQGMDCTNFVIWAFKQNGMYPNDYYGRSNTNKTREVVNKLQVGDFLLTPCNNDCNGRDFTHIGIIIGINDRYIYVAEAATVSIDAIVVTKLEKSNMPSSGKFSVAKFYKYSKNGNISNMWME